VRSSSSALIAALIGVVAAVVVIASVVVITIAVTVTAASWPWAPVTGWFWFILTSGCVRRGP